MRIARLSVAAAFLVLAACGGETVQLGDTGSGGTGGASAAGGGGGGGGNGGGSGGSVTPPPKSEQLDLLLVVDNSISMADKQALLVDAMPELFGRLINPRCADSGGNFVSQPGTPGDPCPAGSHREVQPVRDMHVGVISSALGGHGGDICDAASPGSNPTDDDHAHLMGTVRSGLPSFVNQGYLAWDPDGKVGGISDPAQLVEQATQHVKAAGDLGCGFEAPLEAMYRFLVDPEPPKEVKQVDGFSTPQGVDAELLTQRQTFLRPSSALAIVLLTDENDCSIRDYGEGVEGQAWLTTTSNGSGLPRATAVCSTNPDDPCCHSCAEGDQPGCTPVAQDPECQKPPYDINIDDPLNLRCWDQKRRFGVDWLYPVKRYVDGFTEPMIENRAGQLVKNPLLASRAPNQIVVTGLVGVPWQDLATPETLPPGEPLALMTSAELSASGRWAWLLPSGNTPPADPLMRESVEPRTGTNPATGQPLAPPGSAFDANSVNSHERNITSQADLQYACITPLKVPRDCAAVGGSGCDCKSGADPGYQDNNPLCQDPATGQYGTVQRFAKAYPGTRELQLLQGLGDRAVVGSACAKTTLGNIHDSAYGYNAAFTRTAERLRLLLQ